ncbi:MAG: 1-aminocyclopropane-1-carboxylate deaminase/D-cysteine desulfhydrase [Bacteroidetes bacterium]|nr:1-aminocyclopropane-1-carboxylate deaminase/D-cysteine desulfhydrase [Bacteroidota bacterium]MBS1539146.1 1-aminocyclopropane-1-carboxylate deaminase/D-cysteine desulfhydrase [Bacteroidota bacterium]
MLNYTETPITVIKNDLFKSKKLNILVKREDLNHRWVSGNKWWKLKYNLSEARRLGHYTLLTFGGAFSNHIYATAAAAKELGFKSIGIIRGERVLPLNNTLSFAEQSGMKLHFVSREEYRKKTSDEFVDSLRKQFGEFYLIPEGGTNELAIRGCAEFAREKIAATLCDYVCLPVGTGGTIAGIISGLTDDVKVIGFPVLKDNATSYQEIKKQLGNKSHRWQLQTDYHFGGYAKTSPDLKNFIEEMRSLHLPLDPVYTGKMMYGIFDLAKKDFFPPGSTVLAIHTGGLQGNL